MLQKTLFFPKLPELILSFEINLCQKHRRQMLIRDETSLFCFYSGADLIHSLSVSFRQLQILILLNQLVFPSSSQTTRLALLTIQSQLRPLPCFRFFQVCTLDDCQTLYILKLAYYYCTILYTDEIITNQQKLVQGCKAFGCRNIKTV